MKKVTLSLVALFILSTTGFCQEVAKKESKPNATITAGGNYVAVKSERVLFTDSVTSKTFTDADGLVVPVYKTAKGAMYVSKISKKTGNYYRKYLSVK